MLQCPVQKALVMAEHGRRKFGVVGEHRLTVVPAMSSSADGYVVLQVADSLVAVYHRAPAAMSSIATTDWIKWTRPLMIFGALAFGAFQFSKGRSGRRSYFDSSSDDKLRRQLLAGHRSRMAMPGPT